MSKIEKMKSFSDLINGDKAVLVDFSAEWCGPCKTMAPVIKEVARSLGDKASVIKVDIDKNQSTATKYQIQGVPTFILFKNGQIKWRQSGAMPANQLLRAIEQHV